MATTKTQEASGRTIAKGLLAAAVLGAMWYFFGKGDRAFESAANSLRSVLSYEVRLKSAGSKTDNVIAVSCPGRFALSAQTTSGSLNRVVVNGQAYAQSDGGRWMKIPASLSGLPTLQLCPQPASASDEPKDLPALLDFLARKARVESTDQTEASGIPCTGWRAVSRGPNPNPKPLLTICISETSNLPVEMVLGEATWIFSKWGQPQKIDEPSIEAPEPPASSPSPTPSS